MKWNVRWSLDSVDDLLQLAARDARLARRISLGLRSFAHGERVDIKKLEGSRDTWRLRVRDWRIYLTFAGNDATVEAIDNRRDAY
jgi:mRNA-degrading endonuclease RelE of RelBE toxin-antitoxin system